VEIVAAAKTRTPEEVQEAVSAGIRIVGENHVREAKRAHRLVGNRVRWHFIGIMEKQTHDLFRPSTLRLFDMIETLSSLDLAAELDRRCADLDKFMPVLIEVNSAREPQKTGVLPEEVPGMVTRVAALPRLRVQGLMTMGPLTEDSEAVRPYFAETRRLFQDLTERKIPGADLKFLSMGMSQSYRVAVEEGANMVRIGTGIFGPRPAP
jgi:hypothetical protein